VASSQKGIVKHEHSDPLLKSTSPDEKIYQLQLPRQNIKKPDSVAFVHRSSRAKSGSRMKWEARVFAPAYRYFTNGLKFYRSVGQQHFSNVRKCGRPVRVYLVWILFGRNVFSVRIFSINFTCTVKKALSEDVIAQHQFRSTLADEMGDGILCVQRFPNSDNSTAPRSRTDWYATEIALD
jgi:hypothetical protein